MTVTRTSPVGFLLAPAANDPRHGLVVSRKETLVYVQAEFLYPALGKAPELRAVLEERVKAQQANGRSISLGVGLFGGPEGGLFVLNMQYPDLAAYEASRRRNTSDPAFPAYQAKIATLLSRPINIELHEVLIPHPAGIVLQAPFFAQTSVVYPALGKGAELRAVLEAQVRSEQAGGQRSSLRASVHGTDGAVFSINRQFQDLAALDSFRNARSQADEGRQAYVARVSSLSARPTYVRLAEVLLVPVPPRP